MWMPPYWLIASIMHGGGRHAAHVPTAAATGQTTKVVRCEACGKYYAYQLTQTGYGAAGRSSVGGRAVALRQAEADLQRLLATAAEVVPCPECGWYQSDMIPEARRRHRRWMVYAGQCLTVGLVPLAVSALLIVEEFPEAQGLAPVFVVVLVCLLAVGVGMFVRRRQLAKNFDPNDQDVEVRTLHGQSRAALLSEQEAQDAPARPVVRRPTELTRDPASLVGLFLAILCAAGLAGCGGFFGVRSLVRANVAARLEKDLQAYVALKPELPPKDVEQPLQFQPTHPTGKVKGKMVVVNVNERKIDDLHFALPNDLCAAKPEEVATVALVTWETSPTSNEPFLLHGPSLYANRFIMIGQVQVFDRERKSEIASGTFFGDVPDFDPEGKPMTGPKPEAQVLAFLAGLPRE